MRKFRQGGRYQPGVKALAGGDASDAKFRLGESSGVKVPVGGKLWLGMMFLVRSSGWGKLWLGVITLLQRFRCSCRAEKG